jgi:hypothetical protein
MSHCLGQSDTDYTYPVKASEARGVSPETDSPDVGDDATVCTNSDDVQ